MKQAGLKCTDHEMICIYILCEHENPPRIFSLKFCKKKLLLNFRQTEPNTIAVLGAGGIGGILSWVLTYPTDVIKSRIQADNLANPSFTSGIHCLKMAVKTEGAQCLVRGIGSAVIR